MKRSLTIFNALFFITMIVVNVLAEYLPIGIGTTGAISAKYPSLFTPAPITFSIWAVIYILVGIFVIYQLLVGTSDSIASQVVSSIGLWFIFSCILNIAWMISWHYDVIWLSLIFMLGLLFSLIMISSKFHKHSDYSFFMLVSESGIDIYLGWIFAATLANITALLIKIGWKSFGLTDQLWTIIALIAGTLIALLLIGINRNFFAALAIVWAFLGILNRHISPIGLASKYPVISITILSCIGVIVIFGIIRFFLPKRSLMLPMH